MEGFCRGCLLRYDEPNELLQYTEKNRRLFVYSTGLQVKRNDTFTFQLCKECYSNMKHSCKFKKQCRTSDKKFRNYLMIKEDGDNFGSFIKNMDVMESLRLPLTSGHSTPAYQKNRDDDNESTCTSIRNFMTDILDGEEMPPTEARIIREVIEEEADVLDDSLDSHWLQDDVTIASDFDVDFGISPFGTPRSIQDNEFSTPRRISDAQQREINYLTSKEIIEKIDKPRTSEKFDMPLLDVNMDFEDIKEIKIKEYIETEDKILKPDPPELPELDNSIPSEVEDMVTENSLSNTLQCFKTDILADLAVKKQLAVMENDISYDEAQDLVATIANETNNKLVELTTDNQDDICIVLNQGTAEKKADAPLINDLEYYVNKAEIKKQITTAKDKSKEYHCSIDRNLEIALKLAGNKEFSLDQLIISPAVSIRSGVSTPTINNILFGDKDTVSTTHPNTSTPTIKDILFKEQLNIVTAPKYFPQVGQFLENLEDIKKDMKMLDDFIVDDENVHLKDDKPKDVKTEPQEFDDHDELGQGNNHGKAINNDDHTDVLEKFLQEADDNPTKLNEEIINQMIDPVDLTKELSDQDLFKRPLTPPYDKYDLEKCLCKICSRTFKSSRSLKIHFAKTHKYKLPNLDPHRNKSQNSKVTVCDNCGKHVKGVANFIRHKKRHLDKLIDIFECDNCKLFFKTRIALLVHMKMHMGLEPKKKKFLCNICGRESATIAHHKLHLRRHLKKVSDTCDVCHKGFYSAYDLKVHMRKHNGEKPYACQYCSNAYKRREALYQHMKRHLGKLEYKCDACDIEFVSKQVLAQHYGSQKCIRKRTEASMKSKEKITISVRTGKGSLDNIKKIMLSNNVNKDIESANDQVESKNMSIEENSL